MACRLNLAGKLSVGEEVAFARAIGGGEECFGSQARLSRFAAHSSRLADLDALKRMREMNEPYARELAETILSPRAPLNDFPLEVTVWALLRLISKSAPDEGARRGIIRAFEKSGGARVVVEAFQAEKLSNCDLVSFLILHLDPLDGNTLGRVLECRCARFENEEEKNAKKRRIEPDLIARHLNSMIEACGARGEDAITNLVEMIVREEDVEVLAASSTSPLINAVRRRVELRRIRESRVNATPETFLRAMREGKGTRERDLFRAWAVVATVDTTKTASEIAFFGKVLELMSDSQDDALIVSLTRACMQELVAADGGRDCLRPELTVRAVSAWNSSMKTELSWSELKIVMRSAYLSPSSSCNKTIVDFVTERATSSTTTTSRGAPRGEDVYSLTSPIPATSRSYDAIEHHRELGEDLVREARKAHATKGEGEDDRDARTLGLALWRAGCRPQRPLGGLNSLATAVGVLDPRTDVIVSLVDDHPNDSQSEGSVAAAAWINTLLKLCSRMYLPPPPQRANTEAEMNGIETLTCAAALATCVRVFLTRPRDCAPSATCRSLLEKVPNTSVLIGSLMKRLNGSPTYSPPPIPDVAVPRTLFSTLMKLALRDASASTEMSGEEARTRTRKSLARLRCELFELTKHCGETGSPPDFAACEAVREITKPTTLDRDDADDAHHVEFDPLEEEVLEKEMIRHIKMWAKLGGCSACTRGPSTSPASVGHPQLIQQPFVWDALLKVYTRFGSSTVSLEAMCEIFEMHPSPIKTQLERLSAGARLASVARLAAAGLKHAFSSPPDAKRCNLFLRLMGGVSFSCAAGTFAILEAFPWETIVEMTTTTTTTRGEETMEDERTNMRINAAILVNEVILSTLSRSSSSSTSASVTTTTTTARGPIVSAFARRPPEYLLLEAARRHRVIPHLVRVALLDRWNSSGSDDETPIETRFVELTLGSASAILETMRGRVGPDLESLRSSLVQDAFFPLLHAVGTNNNVNKTRSDMRKFTRELTRLLAGSFFASPLLYALGREPRDSCVVKGAIEMACVITEVAFHPGSTLTNEERNTCKVIAKKVIDAVKSS